MFPGLHPLQQIIIHHFFDPQMDDKNLIIKAHMVKALFVLQILDSIQTNIFDVCPCLLFSRSHLLIKSSQFIRFLFHSSLALWSFSSAKSRLLRSSLSWSVSLLKTKLVPLKANTFTTAPSIVNNNDATYFLPKMISNQSSHQNQKCND